MSISPMNLTPYDSTMTLFCYLNRKDNFHGITVEPVWNLMLGITTVQMIGKEWVAKIVQLCIARTKKTAFGMICLVVENTQYLNSGTFQPEEKDIHFVKQTPPKQVSKLFCNVCKGAGQQIQIIHRFFLILATYCQAPSINC